MRKGFNGLFAEAKRVCSEDPFAGHLFVFVGRNKGTVKVLWWSDGGLSLYSKRLEKGHFRVCGGGVRPNFGADGCCGFGDDAQRN